MATTLEIHRMEEAFRVGLAKFREKFEEAERVTAREFAWRTFSAAAEKKASDPRFPAEAPAFAYRLLVQEHARFNEYARP